MRMRRGMMKASSFPFPSHLAGVLSSLTAPVCCCCHLYHHGPYRYRRRRRRRRRRCGMLPLPAALVPPPYRPPQHRPCGRLRRRLLKRPVEAERLLPLRWNSPRARAVDPGRRRCTCWRCTAATPNRRARRPHPKWWSPVGFRPGRCAPKNRERLWWQSLSSPPPAQLARLLEARRAIRLREAASIYSREWVGRRRTLDLWFVLTSQSLQTASRVNMVGSLVGGKGVRGYWRAGAARRLPFQSPSRFRRSWQLTTFFLLPPTLSPVTAPPSLFAFDFVWVRLFVLGAGLPPLGVRLPSCDSNHGRPRTRPAKGGEEERK